MRPRVSSSEVYTGSRKENASGQEAKAVRRTDRFGKRSSRLLRATSFRLALLQTAIFIIASLIAGTAAVVVVRRDELQAVDAEIAAAVDDLRAIYAEGGLTALKATIAARQRDPSIWEFRVEDRQGRRLAGDLPSGLSEGWSTRRIVEGDKPGGESEVVRTFASALNGGLQLLTGEDLGERERADNAVMGLVAAPAAGAAALSLILAAVLGHRELRRIEEMTAVMERFGAGDHSARVGRGRNRATDLEALATGLNSMLQRTTRLMTGMRQITADIAHDLRRPLARHRLEVARALRGPASLETYRAALETAGLEIDEVLQTFQSLLHIAELEAGAPGLQLTPVDLAEVAARVVQAFGATAEENGRSLDLEIVGRPKIASEPRLLGQMVSNLVENALGHTPVGTRVLVRIDAVRPQLIVSDDGPGVPLDMLERIFERFVCLDVSRSSSGNGLGLALSAAVAQLSGGHLRAEDARPGLKIVADFHTL